MVTLFFFIVIYSFVLALYTMTQSELYQDTLNIVTMVALVLVTACLSCVYAPMQKKLNLLPMGYRKTKNAFRTLFFVFLISYLLQAAAFIFVATGKCLITSYAVIFVLAILDLVPIHCVLYLHRSTELKRHDERA